MSCSSPSSQLIRSRRVLLAELGLLAVCGPLLASCKRRERPADTAIVGSSPTGVPFSFVDPWTNELTGSMVDTVRGVAQQAKVTVELAITPFSALIPSLLAHKIDVIAAALLRTPEREKVVAFSRPVYAYGGGVVVAKTDTHDHTDLASLRGLRVGAQVGTRFVDQLRDAGVARVSTYDNLSDILRDLEHGRIDAAYGDAPILSYQLRIGARPHLRLVEGFRAPSQEALCFVFRHGDSLLTRFDRAIDSLHDTLIPAIAHHWELS